MTGRKVRGKYKPAYVGCYEDGNLIGIAYGWSRQETDKKDTSFMLDGITVEWEKKAHGLGSDLLKFWEMQVRKLGYEKTSVGSEPGYPEQSWVCCTGA